MRRKSLFIGIILLIIGLSLGYAVLSSNLNINGTSHINNATWNIYWDNVQVTTGSVTASTPNISNGTTVSYNVTLTNPGDYYEFTVDAVNAGSINAIIDSITTTLNDGPMTSLPSYLTYSLTNENGDEIAVGQELNSGETKKYKFRIDYKKDVNQNQLPTSDEDLEIKVVIVYVQNPNPPTIPDEPVDPTELVYASPYYPTEIRIGEPLPSNVQLYNDVSTAAAIYTQYGFLGIKLNENIIEELYVVFNYYGDIYFMRGGIDPSSPDYQKYRNQNMSLLASVTGEENCSWIGNTYSCTEPNETNGYYFQVSGSYICSLHNGLGCYVYHNGMASCN